MFYSRSSGFLCATFRALAKWNKIRAHFWIITAVKPKGKRCITSPLHSTHTFFFIRIKQIIYLFSVFFPGKVFFSRQYSRMSATYFPYYPQPQYAVPPFYGSQLQGAQEIHSSSVRPHSDLPGMNCKRTATAAVAALVQRRKIVGLTLKKISWWSCLEKMKISCDTKNSAPLNGCRLLASCTHGARNKT